ncbi:MAG: amidohydrolase family protein [Rhodoplanes sp.]
MRMIYRFLLATAFVTTPILAAAHNDLAREPRGIDTLVPTSSPSQPDSSSRKITIYTAKRIVTLDPGTPSAEAVAVMNGKILGVGTLDEVRGWITNEEFEIDRRFQDVVIIPGLIEAHMHPQITGVLWQGVYVGRFDRTAPDGTSIKGLETKQAAIEQLRNAAAKMPADGRWLLAWGYQPEFYGDSPLTRADLDPISNGHPMFIENLSMHIYYAKSKALEIAGITDKTDVAGIVKKDGTPTSEIKEIRGGAYFRREAAAARRHNAAEGHLGRRQARASRRSDDVRRPVLRHHSGRL